MKQMFRSILRQRGGNVAILAATSMPVLIGGAAIGVDLVRWELADRQAQRAADSAAFAGAYAKIWGTDVAAAVQRDLQLNSQITLAGQPIIENAPTTGQYAGNMWAVRVVLAANVDLPFVRFFRSAATIASAEATAMVTPNARSCVLSLERGATIGISLSGSSTIDFDCGLFSNSLGSGSITASGSTSVTTTSAAAVGSITGTINSPVIQPNRPPLADPYLTLPEAQTFTGNNCANRLVIPSSQTVTLSPGCYSGMQIQGNVTLSPGTYTIANGDLSIAGGSNVTGSGVTFVLTGSQAKSIGTVSLSGNATLNLTPPASGDLGGVLFYQDRRAEADGTNSIAGNSVSLVRGILYFPNQTVRLTGSAQTDFGCVRIVSRLVEISGNLQSQNVCPDEPAYKLFGEMVRLVD